MGSHRSSGPRRDQPRDKLPAAESGPPPLKNQAGRERDLQSGPVDRSAGRAPPQDAGEDASAQIERNAIGDKIIKGQEKMAKPENPEPPVSESYDPNRLTVCVQRLGNGFVAYPSPDGTKVLMAEAAGATDLSDAQRAVRDIIQDWEDAFERRKRETLEAAEREKQRQFAAEHANVESFEEHREGRSESRGQWLPRMFQRAAG
jgi:hypothetical protein